MFTFELTDNYILIYNHKTKEIIKEEIPYNIISNNKIYDYLKLNKIIIDIINKYKLLNSLFKTKINILIFDIFLVYIVLMSLFLFLRHPIYLLQW